MDIQTKLCVTQNFENDLVGIHKNKVTLTLNKPVYIACNVYFGMKQSINVRIPL